MKKKRYPLEMFFVGLFMSLIRTFYVPVVALGFLLLHFVLPQHIPVLAAFLVFLLWPIYAIIDQLKVRREIMSNEEYGFMTDADKADSWKEELRQQVKAQIDAELGLVTPEEDGRETEDQDSKEEP